MWLEEYLKTFNRILLIISHSQDFLNGVCTNIIHMQKKALVSIVWFCVDLVFPRFLSGGAFFCVVSFVRAPGDPLCP